MGTKSYKKIWEQKSRNKNSKNLGTKVIKIREQSPGTKSRNKNYKNLGTKITKIWE
jgi:hypothetical protein